MTVHTLQPFSRDLEENVLGAILAAAALDVDAGHRLIDRIIETGLAPGDFYLPSLGRLYHLMLNERYRDHPIDAVSLAGVAANRDDPHVRGQLERLAHTCPAMTPAPHWASLVLRDARDRRNAAA